jgi:hypothetical protein
MVSLAAFLTWNSDYSYQSVDVAFDPTIYYYFFVFVVAVVYHLDVVVAVDFVVVADSMLTLPVVDFDSCVLTMLDWMMMTMMMMKRTTIILVSISSIDVEVTPMTMMTW